MSESPKNDLDLEIDPEMEKRAKDRAAKLTAAANRPGSALASSAKGLGSYGTLGMEIVVSILLGLFGGQWLDSRWNTSPLLTIVGLVLAAITIVRAVVRVMRDMRRDAAREEAAEGNPAPLWETSHEQKERERDEREQAEEREQRKKNAESEDEP